MNKAQVINKLKPYIPIGLAVLSAGGVVGTAILSSKAAIKTHEKAKKAQYEFLEPKEKAEFIFKVGVPNYAPAAVIGGLTIAASIGAVALGRKETAVLASTLAGTDTVLRKYEAEEGATGKMIEAFADEKEELDIFDTGTGDNLYFEPYSHQFFLASETFVVEAQYHLNRNYILRDYATLSEFLEFLGLRTSKYSDSIGWSCISEGAYGYRWVDFTHTARKTKNGVDYISIDYPFAPHWDFLDPYNEEQNLKFE